MPANKNHLWQLPAARKLRLLDQLAGCPHTGFQFASTALSVKHDHSSKPMQEDWLLYQPNQRTHRAETGVSVLFYFNCRRLHTSTMLCYWRQATQSVSAFPGSWFGYDAVLVPHLGKHARKSYKKVGSAPVFGLEA